MKERGFGLEVELVEEEVPTGSPYDGVITTTEVPSEFENKGIDWDG